jgi:hypothetical protein
LGLNNPGRKPNQGATSSGNLNAHEGIRLKSLGRESTAMALLGIVGLTCSDFGVIELLEHSISN